MENTLEQKTPIVSKNKLLEAGVYFGHNTSQWNPKMQPFIHMKRRRTHIIDLVKTTIALNFSYDLIKKYTEKKASFIFVGTKRVAKKTIEHNARRTNSFYVSERWLGGTLTNHRTIQKQVRKLEELEKLEQNDFEGYTKKEGVKFAKQLAKLRRNLSGIRNMKFKPHLMIVADPTHDIIAIQEAKKSGIKVIGIVDTNTDPTLVDVPIPANDDSIKSVTLIMTILADAIVDAKGGVIEYAFKDDESIVLPVDPLREEKIRKYNERKAQFRQNRDAKYNRYNKNNDETNNRNTFQKQEVDMTNLDKLKKNEIIPILESKNIEFNRSALKKDLIELLKNVK